METWLTNEWTRTERQYPPCGRAVLCVATVALKSGSREVRYVVAKWNGMYWVDADTNVRVDFGVTTRIDYWYMFEKFNPRMIE